MLVGMSRLGSAIDYDDRSNQWESVNNLTVGIGFRRTNRVTMSQQVAQLSGNANNGTNASFFYWNLNNSSGNANRNIAAQVSLSRNLYNIVILASWQNTQLNLIRC